MRKDGKAGRTSPSVDCSGQRSGDSTRCDCSDGKPGSSRCSFAGKSSGTSVEPRKGPAAPPRSAKVDQVDARDGRRHRHSVQSMPTPTEPQTPPRDGGGRKPSELPDVGGRGRKAGAGRSGAVRAGGGNVCGSGPCHGFGLRPDGSGTVTSCGCRATLSGPSSGAPIGAPSPAGRVESFAAPRRYNVETPRQPVRTLLGIPSADLIDLALNQAQIDGHCSYVPERLVVSLGYDTPVRPPRSLSGEREDTTEAGEAAAASRKTRAAGATHRGSAGRGTAA